MGRLSDFGNDLYTGKRSYDFVGKRKIWFSIAAVLVLLSILLPVVRGGFNLGIEFKGGSEFRISNVQTTNLTLATDAVQSITGASSVPTTQLVGQHSILVETETVTTEQAQNIRQALSTAYKTPLTNVTISYIDASWGQDVTSQALRGLVVFVALAAIFMALYFRTWKMSLAALIALVHDLVITAGVYGATGFEVTPAAVIGFLTILGYSLYDTVVVFDKIRENTKDYQAQHERTYHELINQAVNQTLVRSINTSVVALLPVASILFIGAFLLGAGTLRDISLALFIGILVGTYSTIFVASPLYALFRNNEPAIKRHDADVLAARRSASAAAPVTEGTH